MSGALNLNQLCSVCRVQKPRYKCPRCRSRTCSVNCVKRHKKISACSGTRDRSTFKSKNELTTVDGLNHDYNYLYSVDQERHRAARDADSRGALRPPREAHKQMKMYLARLHIDVRRMPQGMSRHQANKTMWNHKIKRVHWTIEWIFPDGTRHNTNAYDYKPLQEVIDEVLTSRGFNSSTTTADSQCTSSPINQEARHNLFPYLWVPLSGKGVIAVAPLDCQDSLNRALSGHSIIEFPSIYLLRRRPDDLPQGFQLASTNTKKAKIVEAPRSNRSLDVSRNNRSNSPEQTKQDKNQVSQQASATTQSPCCPPSSPTLDPESTDTSEDSLEEGEVSEDTSEEDSEGEGTDYNVGDGSDRADVAARLLESIAGDLIDKGEEDGAQLNFR